MQRGIGMAVAVGFLWLGLAPVQADPGAPSSNPSTARPPWTTGPLPPPSVRPLGTPQEAVPPGAYGPGAYGPGAYAPAPREPVQVPAGSSDSTVPPPAPAAPAPRAAGTGLPGNTGLPAKTVGHVPAPEVRTAPSVPIRPVSSYLPARVPLLAQPAVAGLRVPAVTTSPAPARKVTHVAPATTAAVAIPLPRTGAPTTLRRTAAKSPRAEGGDCKT